MREIQAVVLTGYGINCENEMALACQLAGAQVKKMHLQTIFSPDFPWGNTHLLLFPGGFSFGDELGAAKTLANRLSYHSMKLRDRLLAFAGEGNCILGICNGFQLLVKLGLLPGIGNHSQTLSLACNDSGRFECRWIHHKVCPSPCVFTRGLDSLYLPVRHGEGKLVGDHSMIQQMFVNQQVVLQYVDGRGQLSREFPSNPNGSFEAIGGVCDDTGRIFGMMAHPEAALYFTHDPRWPRTKIDLQRKQHPLPKEGQGLNIFNNVINFLRQSQ